MSSNIHPIDQTEMLAYLVGARVLTEVMPIEDLLGLTGRLADLLRGLAHMTPRPLQEQIERARRTAYRASNLVPGARCLQRALAKRIWLARRNVDSEVVFSLRKSGDIEGHAWLEVTDGTISRELFREDDSDYRESFRESQVSARAA